MGPDGYNTFPTVEVIGSNDADNNFDSSSVLPDDDGSVYERLEDLKANTVRCVSLGQAAAAMTGTATKFTVSGAVQIKHLGVLVTTAIPAGANTLKFQFTPTGGSATDLCAATDTASAAKGQFFMVDGVKATALVKVTDPGIVVAANEHMPIVLGPGVITAVYSAGAPATGAITMFVQYEPVVPFAAVI